MVTHGVSPKVLLPFIAGIAAGAVLLIVGVATGDGTLKVTGTSILVAAAGHAGIGYVSPAGPVDVDATPQDSEAVLESTSPRPARKRAA